jgi:hypothetical protein
METPAMLCEMGNSATVASLAGTCFALPVGLSFDIELEARDSGGLFLGVRALKCEKCSGSSQGCGLEEASTRESLGHIENRIRIGVYRCSSAAN